MLGVVDDVIDATGGIPQDFQHYDDFGWWALALVNTAQVLGGPRVREYIATAETVFQMCVCFNVIQLPCQSTAEMLSIQVAFLARV